MTDYDGKVVFENSLIYGDGVLEYVLGKDTFFYVSRHIPAELRAIGRKLVPAFDIRRKFFHFEFFKINGTYMPIEINCRPPGGAILDMMNYSVDDDLYRAYADMIAGGRPDIQIPEKILLLLSWTQGQTLYPQPSRDSCRLWTQLGGT